MADTFKFVQAQSFTLAGAGAVIGDTSVVLSSLKQIDGTTNLTMTDFGSVGYMTLEPNSGTQEEQISFSGITQNANGTATLTGVKNVLFIAPYTESSGLAKTHAGGTKAIASNTAGFYNKLNGKDNDEIITGLWQFPNDANTPILGTSYVAPTISWQIASKGYVDAVASFGAPLATNLINGIGKLSVAAASPGAPIMVGDNDNRVSPVSLATVTTGRVAALAGNNTDIAVGSGNLYVTQTGLQHNAEKYVAVASGSTTAYTATLAPAPTSQTDGMVVYLKMDIANTTTTPTLAVNGLTARTIVKRNGSALAVGDIGAGMMCTFIYDLTNTRWVLQSPVSTAPITDYNDIVNTDPSSTTYQTWTTPLLWKTDAGPAYSIAGFVSTSSNSNPVANNGGAGISILGANNAFIAYSQLPGYTTNLNYTAASAKIIKFKLRAKLIAQGSNHYASFGFADAAATLQTIQSDTGACVRFALNNATLYASNSSGTANTSTDISASLTYTSWNVFEIVFTPGTNAVFYVNGTAVATHTTNLPAGSLQFFGFGCENAAGSQIGYFSPVTFSLQQ